MKRSWLVNIPLPALTLASISTSLAFALYGKPAQAHVMALVAFLLCSIDNIILRLLNKN